MGRSRPITGYARLCRAEDRAQGGRIEIPLNLSKSNLNTTAMSKFIVFNTQKQAKHWVKFKNAIVKKQLELAQDSERFAHFRLSSKNRVVYVSGWQCGCGCDQGHTSVSVVGRFKSA